jgi:peptide/nickel transport system substrate-binding protein
VKNFFHHALIRRHNVPGTKNVRLALRSFSLAERMVFFALLGILGLSAVGLLYKVNNAFLVEMPAEGGTLVEGIVGYPRFINPILASTDTDKDLSAVIYSGLMRLDEKGEFVPDLAESYTVSDDGLTYAFVLKSNARFHDGYPVTADDVLFTIDAAKSEAAESSVRAAWNGVTAEKTDDGTVRFTLTKPYAPFLENAAIGILPRHLWEDIPAEEFGASQRNSAPVGSGPYMMGKVSLDEAGIPQAYELNAFEGYTSGAPYIPKLIFRFYSNEERAAEAYEAGDVTSLPAAVPEAASRWSGRRGARIERMPLPRVFGVFFNQSHALAFADLAARQALDALMPREEIVKDVLFGYGTAIDGPFPGSAASSTIATTSASTTVEAARTILEDGGWEFDTEAGTWEKKINGETVKLSFSLATAETPELRLAAERIKAAFEAVGAKVELKVLDATSLNQTVIRPRTYDALLFGQVVGRNADLYPFWHSSQRTEGLNVSLYANTEADKLLETLKASEDAETREKAKKDLADIFREDVPASFAYSPDFIYILPEKLRGFTPIAVTAPADRLANIHRWYIETERVWRIFIK